MLLWKSLDGRHFAATYLGTSARAERVLSHWRRTIEKGNTHKQKAIDVLKQAFLISSRSIMGKRRDHRDKPLVGAGTSCPMHTWQWQQHVPH